MEWQKFSMMKPSTRSPWHSAEISKKNLCAAATVRKWEEVYEWLENGAHFYVCGDATHMAKDVHDALVSIVAENGKKSQKEAEQYVSDLRRAKRYQRMFINVIGNNGKPSPNERIKGDSNFYVAPLQKI